MMRAASACRTRRRRPLLREIVDEDPSQVDAALDAGGDPRADGRARRARRAARRARSTPRRTGRTRASIASLALRLGGLLEETRSGSRRGTSTTRGSTGRPRTADCSTRSSRLLGDEGDASERADLIERRLAIETGPGRRGDGAGARGSARGARRRGRRRARAGARLPRAPGERDASRPAGGGVPRAAGAGASSPSCACSTRARDRTRRSAWRGCARRRHLADRARATRRRRPRRSARRARRRPDDTAHPRRAGGGAGRGRAIQAAALTELSAAIERRLRPTARRAASLLAARASMRGKPRRRRPARSRTSSSRSPLDRRPYAAALAEQLEQLALPQQRGRRRRRRTGCSACAAPTSCPTPATSTARAQSSGSCPTADPKDKAALRTLASLETAPRALGRGERGPAAARRRSRKRATPPSTPRCAWPTPASAPGDRATRAARSSARGSWRPADRAVRRAARARLRADRARGTSWRPGARGRARERRRRRRGSPRCCAPARCCWSRAGDAGGRDRSRSRRRARCARPTRCVGRLADALHPHGSGPGGAGAAGAGHRPAEGEAVARARAPLLRGWRGWRGTWESRSRDPFPVAGARLRRQNGEVCSDVALRAMELDQLELANRALRAVTLLKTPGPMSKALAYQYMGEIARQQGDAKRALMLLKRALTEDPDAGGRARADRCDRARASEPLHRGILG